MKLARLLRNRARARRYPDGGRYGPWPARMPAAIFMAPPRGPRSLATELRLPRLDRSPAFWTEKCTLPTSADGIRNEFAQRSGDSQHLGEIAGYDRRRGLLSELLEHRVGVRGLRSGGRARAGGLDGGPTARPLATALPGVPGQPRFQTRRRSTTRRPLADGCRRGGRRPGAGGTFGEKNRPLGYDSIHEGRVDEETSSLYNQLP